MLTSRELNNSLKAELLSKGTYSQILPLTEAEQERMINICSFPPAEQLNQRICSYQQLDDLIEMLTKLKQDVVQRVWAEVRSDVG